MGHKKLIRFEEIKSFSNVKQFPEGSAGTWHSFFGNTHPITLELACGKGEYTLGLSRMYAERNFLGIDIKGNRIWRGAKTALAETLNNAGFLRINIDQITDFFAPGEVDEIWITFPDPQLKLTDIRKRLTHPKFLRKYKSILKAGGIIHLKTDSPSLYAFTTKVVELYKLTLLEKSDHVYASGNIHPELNIKTYYESLDIAGKNRVHYVKFQIDNDLDPELDAPLKDFFRPQE